MESSIRDLQGVFKMSLGIGICKRERWRRIIPE